MFSIGWRLEVQHLLYIAQQSAHMWQGFSSFSAKPELLAGSIADAAYTMKAIGSWHLSEKSGRKGLAPLTKH